MEIIATEKPTSWADRLKAMELGGIIYADYSNKNTVRASIRSISIVSNKKFTTKKETGSTPKKNTVLVIERVK